MEITIIPSSCFDTGSQNVVQYLRVQDIWMDFYCRLRSPSLHFISYMLLCQCKKVPVLKKKGSEELLTFFCPCMLCLRSDRRTEEFECDCEWTCALFQSLLHRHKHRFASHFQCFFVCSGRHCHGNTREWNYSKVKRICKKEPAYQSVKGWYNSRPKTVLHHLSGAKKATLCLRVLLCTHFFCICQKTLVLPPVVHNRCTHIGQEAFSL